MMDQVTAQVVIGALFAYVLQWLKKATWFPLFEENSARAWKVAVSGLIAAGTAASINFSWQATGGVLTISGVTGAHVWNALVAFGVSFLSQHGTYEVLIHKDGGVK